MDQKVRSGLDVSIRRRPRYGKGQAAAACSARLDWSISIGLTNGRYRRYFAVGARVGEGPKTTQSGPGLVFMIPGRLRIEAIEKDRGIRLLIGRRPADPPDFDPGMTVPKFGDVLVPGSA